MKITTKIGWTAFLVAIATFNLSPAEARVSFQPNQVSKPTVEERLNRIAAVLKTRESQRPQTANPSKPFEIAGGWGNRSGGGGFVNARGGGGFANGGGGGGFVNVNPWRNGWGDGGGGFLNRRY